MKPNIGPRIWANSIFLLGSPLLVAIWVPSYLYLEGNSAWLWVGLVAGWVLTGLGITIGYHRLFSHRSYEGNALWRAWWLFWGGAALQNSCLVWSAGHRRHHDFTDTDQDPYSVKHGFWWAHIEWILHSDPVRDDFSNCKDLQEDPLVMAQHRHYWTIVFLAGLFLPLAFGALIGRPVGMFLFAALLRMVITHQTTFLINSLCHVQGERPWDENASAADNWFVAFFTHGEGWHSFHHRFPSDYRNGYFWHNWDPGKWAIWTGSKLGLTRNLKRRKAADRIAARRRTAASAV